MGTEPFCDDTYQCCYNEVLSHEPARILPDFNQGGFIFGKTVPDRNAIRHYIIKMNFMTHVG